ncbi:hypothetical protein T439DRAFT_330489 [Meredithblackwellia eburnea MCA 4105]
MAGPDQQRSQQQQQQGSFLLVSHTPETPPDDHDEILQKPPMTIPSPILSRPDWSPVQPTSSSPSTRIPHEPDIDLHDAQLDDMTANWDEWVQHYRSGKWKPDETPSFPYELAASSPNPSSISPVPPPSPRPLQAPPSPSASVGSLPQIGLFPERVDELHIYPSSSLTTSASSIQSSPLASSAEIIKFYKANGYFPAPKGIWNDERLQLIRRYGLDQPTRRAAVDRVCRIAKAHWNSKIVMISIVFDEHMVLAAETGFDVVDPGPDVPPREMEWPSSLCPHGMTQLNPAGTFVVPNIEKDWRFAKNPYSSGNGGPLSFYASANIHLPTAPLHSTPPTATQLALPPTLPVGSICIIDDKPRASAKAFSEADRRLLHDLADAVAREFQLGFEQIRRNTESRQVEFLGEFLSTSLVSPSPHEATTPPHSPRTKRAPTTSALETDDLSHPRYHSFSGTARQLRQLTDASSAVILDLRSYSAPVAPRSRESSANSQTSGWDGRWGNAFADYRLGDGTIFVMGSDGPADWKATVSSEGFGGYVSKFLAHYYRTGQTEFDQLSLDNPLSPILPPGTVASCAVPLNDVDGTPALLMILTSADRHFQFEPTDRRFMRHIGAVIIASLLRQRALEADRAKLAFLSQISHELRTPLFGVNSQLELIREFSTPLQLARLRPILDVADVCLETLRDVLDDTLDFAKNSNKSPLDKQKASLVKADLSHLVEDVVKATWVRKERVDLVTADATANGHDLPPREKVDVILEVERRESSWMAMLDVGGIKRLLMNIVGNSLKFTKRGHVKVTLQELPVAAAGDLTSTGAMEHLIAIDVEDTGCGMSEEFIRDGKLFTPFIQENSFSNGAGLGMSICESIVRRLGGKIDVLSTLGKGTTMRVTLPLTFVTRTPTVASPRREPSSYLLGKPTRSADRIAFRRRVLSDELGTFLATPGSEKGGFDFGQAIEDQERPMELVLPPLSKAKPQPSVMGEKEEAPDFAFEVSRLTLTGLTLPKMPPLKLKRVNDDPVPLLDSPDTPTGTTPTGTTPSGASQTTPTAASALRVSDWLSHKIPEDSIAPDVRVLVAEDNPIAANILIKLLSGKGIAHELARDGQEAVDRFKANRFNLLLLDIQMPIKDGIQAAHEIREYEKKMGYPRTRLVVLSGLSNDVDKAAALDPRNGEQGPVDNFITKGGKSLRLVLEEAKQVQEAVEADF